MDSSENEEVATVDGKIVLTQTIPELAATENYVATAYEFVEWVNIFFSHFRNW